jgi:hypothetical protein
MMRFPPPKKALGDKKTRAAFFSSSRDVGVAWVRSRGAVVVTKQKRPRSIDERGVF